MALHSAVFRAAGKERGAWSLQAATSCCRSLKGGYPGSVISRISDPIEIEALAGGSSGRGRNTFGVGKHGQR